MTTPSDDPAAGPSGAERLHEKAGRILADAEGVPADELDAFLARESGDDAALLALLREMAPDFLAAREFMRDTPGDAMRARLDARAGEPVEPAPGTELGAFRIVRRIAQGGMGTVYEAEQLAPRRRVALKVVSAGMATPEILRRFRLEGDVLAHLSHPGIAKVLAVSPPEAPSPWFAMELVEGLRLTEHADARGLSIPERLGLLAATCDAVAHAHARGVVHRDLKPSNILVDAEGRPRVLDFGVARASELEDRASTFLTRTGDLVGTLAYMSPEQAMGRPEDVDRRADVFSLGVIGFEMLTGRLPRRLEGLSLGEALLVLREGDMESASTANPALSRDVATLLSKALDADPARRYDSAAELAADIRRCLRNEPIVARPASLGYRASKFLQRHRALALTTLVAFAAVGLVAILAVRSAVEAARERRIAEENAARASLAAAVSDLDSGNGAGARRSLDVVPPALRGWEWDVLAARLPLPSASVALEGAGRAVAASDGRSVFVLASAGGGHRLVELSLPGLAEVRSWTPGREPLDVPAEARPLLAGALIDAGLAGDAATETEAWRESGDLVASDLRVPRGLRRGWTLVLPGGRFAWGLMEDAPPGVGTLVDLATGRAMWSDGGGFAGPCLAGDVALSTTVSAVVLRDLRTGAKRLEIPQAAASQGAADGTLGEGFMTAVASADGRSVLTASYASPAILCRFDATTGELLGRRTVAARPSWEDSHWAVAAGGDRVAWAAGDGAVHVLSADLARHLATVYLAEPGRLSSVVLTPGGETLVAVESAGRVHARDLAAAVTPRVIEAHRSYVYSVAWWPDGARFVTAGWDQVARVFDGETSELLQELPFGAPDEWLVDAQPTPDGKRLVLMGTGASVQVIDPSSGATIVRRRCVDGNSAEAALALDPRGELAFVGLAVDALHGGAVVRLSDLSVAEGYDDVSRAAAWSPDGSVLAAATETGGVLIDRATGARRPLDVPGGDRHVARLRWSADGSRLVAALFDGMALVLDPTTGRRVMELEQRKAGAVRDAVFSPDGLRIVTGAHDGAVRVWDASSGALLASWPGHGLYVRALAFRPDGALLLSASGDRTVRRWDARDDRTRNEILARRAAVR